jgi:hypothetical protein
MDQQRLALLKRKLEALNYDGELDTKSAPLAEKVRTPPARLPRMAPKNGSGHPSRDLNFGPSERTRTRGRATANARAVVALPRDRVPRSSRACPALARRCAPSLTPPPRPAARG